MLGCWESLSCHQFMSGWLPTQYVTVEDVQSHTWLVLVLSETVSCFTKLSPRTPVRITMSPCGDKVVEGCGQEDLS